MATTDPGRTSTTPDYPPPPPALQPRGNTRTLVVVGFVLAGIGLVILPILFCPAAIILGVVASRRGDPLGKWVIAAGVVSLVAAIVIAAALYDSLETESSLTFLR